MTPEGAARPGSVGGFRAGAVVLVLLAVHAAWSCLYIHRTSVMVGTVRVHTLWDDGMISMTYARNFAEGHGLVWNPGEEKVQGYSNLGVVLVMALVHRLPVGPVRTAAVFQLIQVIALAWTLFVLSRLPALYWDADAPAGPATVAVAAVFAPLSIWALQGSDVGLVAAALATAAWLAGRSYARGGAMGLGPFVVLAAAVVLRIDSTLFYVTYLTVALRGGNRRVVAAATLLLVATWAALAAFGWAYYGDPLPNTYYLKATGAPRHLVLARGLGELWALAACFSPVLVLVTAAWCRVTVARAPLPLLWLPAVLGVAYNTWVGGDWRPDYLSRFAVPGLAVAIPLFVAACRWIAVFVAEGVGLAGRWLTGAAVALVAAFALQASPRPALAEWLYPGTETLLRSWNLGNVRHGLYFARFTTPGTTLALHWAGVPAYFARRPSIDVLGRSDLHIARLRVDRHEPGHSKWDWDYVIGTRRPDIFQHESRGLLERDDFRRGYLHARTPEGLEFYVKRGSIGRLRDPEAVLTPMAGPGLAPRGLD